MNIDINFKENFIRHLEEMKKMSNEELILYKKWNELNYEYKYPKKKLDEFEEWIWKPTNPNNIEFTIKEITNLKPKVYICNSAEEVTKWNIYRRLITSLSYSPNFGRIIRSFVIDDVSGKLLGIISLSSDVPNIEVRDEYIGWTHSNKFKDKKINNTCIGTSIVPTQPFGYNFLGGKLLSILTTSKIFRDEWEKRYNDVLVCITTTSLYGIHSQYNGLPQYKTLGLTKGDFPITPNKQFYKPCLDLVKKSEWFENEKQKKGVNNIRKNQYIKKIFKEIGIDENDYKLNHTRGVYISMLYENGKEFLTNKIPVCDLKLKKRYDLFDNVPIEWWKNKSIKRYTKLMTDKEYKNEILWYSDIIGMDWLDCYKKYINDLGR